MQEPTGTDTDTAAALPITVTHHSNLYIPTAWAAEQTTWGDFVAALQAAGHRQDLQKESAPLISLYALRAGGKRCTADVQLVYGLLLDYDDVPAEALADCLEALAADGLACLGYTTWKHLSSGEGLERWRLIVPLAAPITAGEYDAALKRVWAKYAKYADRDADGVARGFFVPSCPPERAAQAQIFYLPGKPLQLPASAAVPAAAPATAAAAPVRVVYHETWNLLVARMKRSSKPAAIDLSRRFENVLIGAPFAAPGERDVCLWDLLNTVVKAYPDVSQDSVWELFRHSIERMAEGGAPDSLTEHDVREKLERARAKHAAEQDTSLPADRKEGIQQAFGSDRSTPYTADELANISDVTGLPPERLRKSWILQYDSDYYVIGNRGVLFPTSKDALLNTCRVVLAPAPVELYVFDQRGRRLKSSAELIADYSLPLTEVRRSLVVSTPVFELADRRVTLPACPKRPLVAKYNVEIDQWLELLAGVKYNEITQWLAHVPDLSRPLTGLVLTGPKSVGKSLLAKGLSRIWCDSGPSKLSDAMGGFNSALERCPFCHADEADIPKDQRGVERTGELREFVQCTQRLINEKFKRQLPLDGAARLQISANNENVFSLHADLTDHDLDAIAERFTHIRCSVLAADYLESRGGRSGVEEWIEGDALPAHVLFLAEQYGSLYTGRFGVEQNASDLACTLAVRGGLRSKVCEILVRVLSKQDPLAEGAYILGRDLVVHLDWILQHWEMVLGKTRPPTSGLIQALEGLGERLEVDGLIYFAIAPSRLEAWAFESGYGTAARVNEWLERHAS
jgi:hypothetical protein